MRLLGILLVIFGVVCLIYQGLSFVIPKETVDMGAFAITVYRDYNISLPPVIGAICLILGAVLILVEPRPYVRV
ncbi:MAG TPA: DUF3185 domain-containing protein [bacterium]|nr:DUF3185 domain-containing protein [bacterium]